MDEVCNALLNEIVRFQDRLYHKNPIKVLHFRDFIILKIQKKTAKNFV